MSFLRVIIGVATLCAAAVGRAGDSPSNERVYLDREGVMRWRADDREVALFGANYCLPSSSDYRAAGYLGADRKKLIDQDVVHFARMGWDGLRLALWGDWENCDREGNLIVNDHLDLLDYLIFRAKERGISMLFTPIHRHTALWPDGQDSDAIQGFSKHYPASELGRNPAAIRAQQNYLRQVLEHVNPYTGIALKNEPAIVFIEMINEPHHHASDLRGSIAYIDALVAAVRSTGCQKLLFHNLSQDFAMAPAIAQSKAQGYSFGWYPTNLVARRTLEENYLRWVDAYSPLTRAETAKLPSIVYEFDSADLLTGYMYPAMVRAFRGAGAQFAAMFAYDMLATAPYNLGWQTHFLNLVYSPRKAVSAVIAAEAMRTLPRGKSFGAYPSNRHFSPFRVSYEEDLSEMLAAETFLHSNTTRSLPPAPAKLRRIAGIGSSPLVRYDGTGVYFLDRLAEGHWRLEVYPDAIVVQDPFAQRLNRENASIRLIWREWPMQIHLPDLAAGFTVAPLDAGNSHAAVVRERTFGVRPGVYLLSRKGAPAPALPERIGHIGLREFVCPIADAPLEVVSHGRASYVANAPIAIDMDIVAAQPPRQAFLHVRQSGTSEWRRVPLQAIEAYRFRAALPRDAFAPGEIEFFSTVDAGGTSRFPGEKENPWRAKIVAAVAPLTLFDPAGDAARIFTMRVSGDQQGNYVRSVPASATDPALLRLTYPAVARTGTHALSVGVASRILDRGDSVRRATALRVRHRGTTAPFEVSLVETDGTTWAAAISPARDWQTSDVPLNRLRLVHGLKLPLGYPGNWNFDLPPAENRGAPGDTLNAAAIQHVQIRASARPASPEASDWAEVSAVELVFE